ncbi:Regulator of chromosome condensation (RCC1) repeat [Phytophthora infestans]|uniref:Regulator of chromosome condensation (RCC1) repeat n=1 Tax=Phytophthora infestans TaxID=4787 RepID=A0A833T9U3_PHYIN|nr:Regulator of chromosome condensation (RCC1) repeat [Phytophthora infestans]
MGVASSHELTPSQEATWNSSSRRDLQCGLNYSRRDLMLWPQLEPVAYWFTAQDCRRLYFRLRNKAGATGLLTLGEFLQWLDVGDTCSKASRPEVSDVMTPPLRRNQQTVDCEDTAKDPPPILAKYLQYVFLTFTDRRGDRLYALEFLAAMVVISRAIWDFSEKVELLLELFHDPATSNRKVMAYGSAQRLKETDVARMLLCVMNGVGRATQGVATVWQTHQLRVAVFARQSALRCMQSIASKRSATDRARAGTRSVSSEEYRAYVTCTPALHQFLSLFSGEELRNPLTFERRAAHWSRQTELYESLLGRYVTFEGREERRRSSAALLIQSTWRRRCSLIVAQRYADNRAAHRHESAAKLQRFFTHRRVARELEARTEIERSALNGGVFVAGSGPSIGMATTEAKKGSNTGAPVRLIGAFVTLNAKLRTLAASSTFALGVQDDSHSLFAWGRCLPRIYDQEAASESEATPRQLHIRLAAPVTEVACGLRHALVLTQDGVVHSWGFNDHGQLGHGSAETVAARTSGRVRYASYYDQRSGEEEEYLASPTKLLYFEGCAAQQADPIPVAHVCCGDYYCMALSRAGDVFTWGEASEGQLGHGETHEYYQVALADRHMVNSAYTYLAQPEPVLALSDVCIAQIACRGNHSVALSTELAGYRLFEWGNWGRRRGVDSEHAFVPEETVGASALRLRQVAVGDHHMLAEGASVWLKLATRTNRPIEDAEEETDFLVEPLAGASSSLEAIEKDFMGKESTSWVCCLVDLDEDDVDEDTKLEGGDDSASSASTKESNKGALWHKRAERFAVSLEGLAGFDPCSLRLINAGGTSNNAASTYAQGIDQWLRGRVSNRLVVMPRGKPAGFYLQFRLPHNTGQVASNGDTRSEDAKADDPSSKSAASGVVLELAVCGSNTAKRAVGRRGFTTHVYHPTMEAAAKRLKQQQLRARSMTKKKPTVTPTETNSIFVLEINQSVLTPLASAVAEGIGTESEAELEAETIISEIGHRVLELQEAGALAVLVVLDLFDADAFTLRFSDDSGVFVPVFMVTRQTQATVIGSYGDAGSVSEPDDGDSTRRTSWTVQVILDYVLLSLTAPALQPKNAASSPRRLSLQSMAPSFSLQPPPPLMARFFYRTDTAATRAHGAFANGAAAVLFVANENPSEPSQAAFRRSLSATLSTHITKNHQLVGLIPHEHGQRLRAASRIAFLGTPAQTPLIRRWSFFGATSTPRASTSSELIADVQFEMRPGGTTYAWGDAESGRLGLGEVVVANAGGDDSTDTVEVEPRLFQDGYEALTDATYSFVAQPTCLPTLVGVEMKQLSCGDAHSLAVTKHGRVFSWGRGTRGQLGHPIVSSCTAGTVASPTNKWSPRMIRGLRHDPVTEAVATDQSSIFLSEIVEPAVLKQRQCQLAQLRAISKQTAVSAADE